MNQLFERWKQSSKTMRGLILAVCVMTIASATVIPVTYAWFTRQKQIAFLTEVDTPQELYIRAGHEEDTAFIDLSNIDVQSDPDNPVTCKDFVFCVKGDVTAYYIQLAHTTNIQFDYSIYRADQKNTEAAALSAAMDLQSLVENDPSQIAVYTSHEVKDNSNNSVNFYYAKTEILNGKYINDQTQNDEKIARQNEDQLPQGKSNCHPDTYNSYGNVQKYAEPLYWHSDKITLTITNDEKTAGEYARYYILHLDWKDKNLTNNKETDMVYITVASAQIVGED